MRHVPLAFLAAAFLVPVAANARVAAFEILDQSNYGRFGDAEYVRIEARVTGELTRTENIPGIDRARANAKGAVEYSTRVLLIVPTTRANGTLVVEVPNRGRVISLALYNGRRDPPTPLGDTTPNTGFLQRHGFALASVTWEYGEGITLPTYAENNISRHLEAVGFAAVRDVGRFLRDARTDDFGNPNPIAGQVDRALAVGYSQTARFLRTFMFKGFNTVDGKAVFEGMHLHAGAAGQMPIMLASAGAKSATAADTPSFTTQELRGVTEPPFTYAEIMQAMRSRDEPIPKLLVTNMTTDYFSLRASLSRTGAGGDTGDHALPPNVRMYDVAGAAHSLNLVATRPECNLPLGKLDYRPVMRSTLVNLNQWVAGGGDPPRTALMPLAPAADTSLMQAPSYLPLAVVQAPQSDADGNFVGGVRLPEVTVPLGVHGRQNDPMSRDACKLVASYVAFPDAEVAKRYPNRAAYVQRIQDAADDLVSRRLLLPEDAAEITRAARSARIGN
jgi:Alpha/beta hydrolase domain